MNIFILDKDVKKCAMYHADKHVVKMITEHVQILSAVIRKQFPTNDNVYRLTHKNHPCTIWAGESLANFLYLISLTEALGEEYTFRYGKQHKALLKLPEIYKMSKHLTFKKFIMTPFAQAMPEQYRNANAVQAYRDYYKGDKQHLFKWKNREIPNWI